MTLIKLELGIITGDDKRLLERLIGKEAFKQRKSYDEYYCELESIHLDITLGDLIFLANNFGIVINEEGVRITYLGCLWVTL